jgi:hypothetical protein
LNILDIVNNLENKLNIALENEIAQKIQNEQFTPLFNGRETFRFKLFLDTANYMGYDYLKRFSTDTDKPGTFDERDLSNTPKNNLVRYINGVISVIDSNVQGGVNLSDETQSTSDVNLTFSAGVVFFIPLTSADNDTMELVGTIREIIDNAMRLNTYADFNGYNMSVAYSLGRTGERLIRKGVGDSVTINCNIQYGFVQGGINSTQIAIKHGNSTVYAPSKSLSRVSAQEANVDLGSGDNATKNTTVSTGFTLHFNKPLQYGDIDNAALFYLLENNLQALEIELVISNGATQISSTIPMIFNEVSITGENTLNAGLSITMVEALEV